MSVTIKALEESMQQSVDKIEDLFVPQSTPDAQVTIQQPS